MNLDLMGRFYLIFFFPFPSFPWSNFHLPEQLQGGEGAGGGRRQAMFQVHPPILGVGAEFPGGP